MFPREVISVDSVVLRPPAEGDVPWIVRACADPLTTRFLPALPLRYGAQDAALYLKLAAERWANGGAEFSITDQDSGTYLGAVGLKVPGAHGGLEIGYHVAPHARGAGVASLATRAVTEWAFGHGVPRVELLTDVENVASQRVALNAGFVEEGIRRRGTERRDGSRADLVSFARLESDPGGVAAPYLPAFAGGELTDGVVRLAPMTLDDSGDYLRLMSDPLVAGYSMAPPPTAESSLERCRHTGYWWASGQRAELSVRDAVTGEFAGHLQLMQVVPVLAQAMVGYSLVPGFRGRGIMTRSVNLLVDWAFANTTLHRIVAGTDERNAASHRVLERAGFARECVHRELFPGPGDTRADDVGWVRLRPRGER